MAVERNNMGEGAMQIGGIIAAVVRGVVPVILAQAAVAHAGEITVLSPNGMRSVVQELAPQFERTTGHKLNLTFGISSALRRQEEWRGSITQEAIAEAVRLARQALLEHVAEYAVEPTAA